MKYAVVAGLGMGGVFGVMFASYALGFWFGSHCVSGTYPCPRN